MTSAPSGQASFEGIPDPSVRILAQRFARQLGDADLQQRTPEVLASQAEELLAFAQQREPGTALVTVHPGTDSSGEPTVLQIATDDMSFLVDSVTGALTSDGRAIHLILHPQLVVRRDESGRLVEILDLDVDDECPSDAHPESWMRIEIERSLEGELPRVLEEQIEHILRDVRVSVRDWRAMRAKALILAEETMAAPPHGLPTELVDEGADYLRWLADDNFTFVGYREYNLVTRNGEDLLVPVDGTGLGILASDEGVGFSTQSLSFASLPPEVRAKARDPRLLIVSKANSRSTVHRPVYLDYIGVKRFDAHGSVVGERRFLGLYSSMAYTQSILDIPILRTKYDRLVSRFDYVPDSHDAKDLLRFLETYPRDELFQVDDALLADIAESVLHLQERRHTKLYLRADDYGRFMSCLVYLPRDRYTTAVRLKIEAILMATFGGASLDYTARVSESVLARLHYLIRVPHGQGIPAYDHATLERQVAGATRSWSDDFAAELAGRVGDARAAELLHIYSHAFPEAYKEDFGPGRAVNDAVVIEGLEPGELSLEIYEPSDGDRRDLRLKITRVGPAMSLSRVLPILQSLGVDVVDEYPYEISRAMREPAWILDFGMRLPKDDLVGRTTLAERFEEAFAAIWADRCGVDGFNALIVTSGLRWRQALVLRAYARYLRQIGTSFSQSYIEEVVAGNAGITGSLVELFEARFDPAVDEANRAGAQDAIVDAIEHGLDQVASLDQDRILRSFLALITATLRTNFFQSDDDGIERSSVAFKLDPRSIPDLPLPKPQFEIWVYAPRVEGVHLRFGSVARGGLRWSDRQEDFRTEVLGLVKAQEVKNAVIVPVGAKGGFYPKRLPDPSIDRDAWLTEGKAAYREFIMSMLDITDNLVDGVVVPPPDVVRHDGDDAYLVVAADKGTATFSDLANSIAAEYGFWLGDAFASGGSVGYDHKAMGITARGAWESVKRHFRELDVDTQTQDFTVAGIGDMSGDVFGNGMLLSEHIRLVVAFDHRHVFVDPTPDAAASFAERQRLFDLPRSSWDDYDRSLISEGGGVFARSLKSVDISPQMGAALGLAPDVHSLTPDELIRAALTAPVDLLWNGGIGTYVKAQTQVNADVGDKANDRIRIDGNDLRCRVVGEGGNLGFTQLGRVEAARNGVRINTDAIDNSAGVDTSDHEVNIKILLDGVVRQGGLTYDERNSLLAEMTDTVASEVLDDNYGQNVVLGNARSGAAALVSVHQRMVRELERTGLLDRAIEYLPDDEQFRTLRMAGEGLSGPELCVLLAYAKISLTSELNASTLADEPFFATALTGYFPHVLAERYAEPISVHPLRTQIISTVTVNRLLNVAGVTFVFRAMEETGASALEVVRAASAAMEIFGIDRIWDQVNAQDGRIPTSAQVALHLETRRLLDRATRWFLQTRGGALDVQAEVARFAPVVAELGPKVPDVLLGVERDRYERLTERLRAAGAPEELAAQAASALDRFSLLDITDISLRTGEPTASVLALYFTVSERYDVDRTLVRITELPRGDKWSVLARHALRSDLYAAVAGLTSRVLRSTPRDESPMDRLLAWEQAHLEGVTRARTTLQDIDAAETPDLATLSVALRALRNLVAQGTTSSGHDS